MTTTPSGDAPRWRPPIAVQWNSLGGSPIVSNRGGAGPEATPNGHISTETKPFLGDHLETPAGAEVHLAVARHGTADPDALPEQIETPAGTSDHRWFAVFD